MILEEGCTIPADGKVRRHSFPLRTVVIRMVYQILGDYKDPMTLTRTRTRQSTAPQPLPQIEKHEANSNESSESGTKRGDDSDPNNDVRDKKEPPPQEEAEEEDEEEIEARRRGPALCSVDQSAITGESLAVEKYKGDVAYYTCGVKRGKVRLSYMLSIELLIYGTGLRGRHCLS